MPIQSIGSNATNVPHHNVQTRSQTSASKLSSKATKAEPKEQYVPRNEQEKTTYEKYKVDHATVARLKEESERAYDSLKRLVEELLRSQGKTFQGVLAGEEGELQVDEDTRIQAQAAISEGGELSPESVSDRLVSFAIAISGGDKSKFELLKSAIDEGFRQAAEALGGGLPAISMQTYDLTMEKLNQWKEDV